MLRDLDIKYRYSTGSEDNPISFFTDSLSNSVYFDLGLGYFSSASINVLATGFARFISNGGKMRMYINQNLSNEDYEAISTMPTCQLEEKILSDFAAMRQLFSKRDKHFFNCLSYLIYNKRIELRIVVPHKGGIAHQKFGILRDIDNNKVCFSGSLNFTANALLRNLETIDCFTSWDSGNEGRIATYEDDFEKVFSGKSSAVITYEPLALKEVIVANYPSREIDNLLKDDESLIAELTSSESDVFARINESIPNKEIQFPFSTGPFDYQKRAYNSWISNGYQGIFAMATGTGKTITSLNCVLEEYKKTHTYKVLILAPSIDLINQWCGEVAKFNFTNVYVVNGQNDWRTQLTCLKNDIEWGLDSNYVIIATYASFTNDKFQSILRAIAKDMILIADEAHNVGATHVRKAFACMPIEKRIALSATPRRAYDYEGTAAIEVFFNDRPPYCCSYSMEEAIAHKRLMQYLYYPRLVFLNNDEMKKYQKLTRQLQAYYQKETHCLMDNPEVKRLLMARKRIIHKAADKSRVFMDIIDEVYQSGRLKYCFVYAPEGKDYRVSDDERILETFKSLVNEKYPYVTTNTYLGEDIGKREKLRSFAEGKIDILFAMKCLDEGVDVPRAEVGIFTSSTGNPRQFIQRRGRLLRIHPDKSFARIYDLIVVPDFHQISSTDTSLDMERNLVRNELERVAYFASLASNYNQARESLSGLLDYYGFEISTLIKELQKQ